MYDEDKLAETMLREISDGQMPSAVFHQLLSHYKELDKNIFTTIFKLAFPDVDGVVWNIIVTHWPRAEKSEYWKKRFDLTLIEQLLDAGYEVPWNRQYLKAEAARLQAEGI